MEPFLIFLQVNMSINKSDSSVICIHYTLNKKKKTWSQDLSWSGGTQFLCARQILNKIFGYEPYPGFCKHVDKKMEAELKGELKQKKIT
jgi:hypothetical protein